MPAPRYQATRIDAATYRRIVETAPGLTLTAFQRPEWVETWLAEIGAATGSEPHILAAYASNTSALALLLPLALRRHRSLDILEGLDQGITDYNAPVLGPAAPHDADDATALWQALAQAMPRADLVRLEKMPVHIDGRINPLAMLAGALPATLSGNVIAIGGSIESHLRTTDRKARKEYERYLRRAESSGRIHLRRAGSQGEMQQVMTALEHHQRQRIATSGRPYLLDLPAYTRFYRNLIAASAAPAPHKSRTAQPDFAQLYYLALDGEPIAFLYGLRHGSSFSLIRISHATGDHERISPGRMIIGETFRAQADQGVRRFDLTIGDYLSKRIFAPTPYPLVELHRPLSLAGGLLTGVARAKHALRQHPALHAAINRLRGRP